jgi:methionine-rich copper-binding protein CopC
MPAPISGCRETALPASRVIRLLLAVPLLACLMSMTAGPANAHAILIRSAPAGTLAPMAGTIALELHYNSRIDAGRSRLTLIRADRSQSVLPILPDTAPDVLRADATLPPGTYTVRWQVLAIDGHITRGDVPFTVTGP